METLSTSTSGRTAPQRSSFLDERRKDPPEQDSGENEETDRDHECDAERETGQGGHAREPVAVGRSPVARNAMRDDDEKARYSSSKAVAATLLLFGIVLVAVLLFAAVLMQRACRDSPSSAAGFPPPVTEI